MMNYYKTKHNVLHFPFHFYLKLTLQEPLEARAQSFKVVAEGEQPVVDTVVVHGLKGHRDKIWTAANGTHWLRDLLPTGISNGRVFC
ncbi:hypothetical protein BJ878DRAFT_494227 [Calycina marina]|uniref:Uncharacterized protein n=1 Tax=Calycina marina TaxID=1763456 RepID=A0A9P8CHA2_9HELO|nr:hypothetical protein BJ878DRAFT_494227 [Calycina marina]